MHSDNNGAIGAHAKGRSLNTEMNLSVRRTYKVLAEHDITPSFIYVASADNPADPVSRGIFPSDMCLTRLFELPIELSSVLMDAW